jgi:hypothetical protein
MDDDDADYRNAVVHMASEAFALNANPLKKPRVKIPRLAGLPKGAPEGPQGPETCLCYPFVVLGPAYPQQVVL